MSEVSVRTITWLSLTVVLVFTISGPGRAQTNPEYIEVGAGRGSSYQINIPAALPPTQQIVVWYKSRGAGAIAVDYHVIAPQGTGATFGAERYVPQRMLRGRSQESFLKEHRISPSMRPFRKIAAVTDDSSSVSASARWFVSRDACASTRTQYRVGLLLDFSQVNEEVRTSGFSLQVQFLEVPWRGSRAASIKPSSDGRFSPEPLLLMSSIAAASGNRDEIVLRRWSRSKIRSNSRIAIRDYVLYRDLFLSRSTIGAALSGGRGSFDMDNGVFTYSVCFDLARIRQTTNGYPE